MSSTLTAQYLEYVSVKKDIDMGRLEVAEKMGATYTVKVTSKDSRAIATNIVEVLKCQPDCSIECSGVETSVATAIYVGTLPVNVQLLDYTCD